MAKNLEKRNSRGRKKKSSSVAKEPAIEAEDCVICLEKVSCRGKLSICEHWFCFKCIHEWAKNNNTCPVCKKRFRCISKTHLQIGKSPEHKVRVPDVDNRYLVDDDDDDPILLDTDSDDSFDDLSESFDDLSESFDDLSDFGDSDLSDVSGYYRNWCNDDDGDDYHNDSFNVSDLSDGSYSDSSLSSSFSSSLDSFTNSSFEDEYFKKHCPMPCSSDDADNDVATPAKRAKRSNEIPSRNNGKKQQKASHTVTSAATAGASTSQHPSTSTLQSSWRRITSRQPYPRRQTSVIVNYSIQTGSRQTSRKRKNGSRAALESDCSSSQENGTTRHTRSRLTSFSRPSNSSTSSSHTQSSRRRSPSPKKNCLQSSRQTCATKKRATKRETASSTIALSTSPILDLSPNLARRTGPSRKPCSTSRTFSTRTTSSTAKLSTVRETGSRQTSLSPVGQTDSSNRRTGPTKVETRSSRQTSDNRRTGRSGKQTGSTRHTSPARQTGSSRQTGCYKEMCSTSQETDFTRETSPSYRIVRKSSPTSRSRKQRSSSRPSTTTGQTSIRTGQTNSNNSQASSSGRWFNVASGTSEHATACKRSTTRSASGVLQGTQKLKIRSENRRSREAEKENRCSTSQAEQDSPVKKPLQGVLPKKRSHTTPIYIFDSDNDEDMDYSIRENKKEALLSPEPESRLRGRKRRKVW